MVRILLVEDNDLDAAIACRAIRKTLGWEVVRARSAAEARAAFFPGGGERFDLVLVDHLLPDGNGLELLAELCARVPGRPLLFLAGQGSGALARQAIERGAAACLVKSLRYEAELPDLVARLRAQSGRPTDSGLARTGV